MVAEAALRARGRYESAFETAFRASPAAMAISSLGSDSRVLDINDAGLRLLGRTRDEVIACRGAALDLWLDPGERERITEQFAVHGVVRDFATRMRRIDGEIVDVVISIELVEMFDQQCALTVLTDVSALCAAERRLEEAQEIGHIGSWQLDIRTGRLAWSKEARRILGGEACSGDDSDWRHLLDTADLQRVMAARETALAETGVFEGEYPIVRSNGERRIVFARGRVERDANGNPLRLSGVLQDITEQRNAREEQRRSAELFETAFRASPAAMAIVRIADSRIVAANDAALTLAGRTRAELVGHTTSELGLWLDEAQRRHLRAEIAASRVVRDVECKLARKDGEIRLVRMSVEKIDIDGEPSMLTVISDITETSAMQRMLEETQALGHVGSWTLDVRTGVSMWSAEVLRIAGVEQAVAIADFFLLVHCDDRARVQASFQRALQGHHEMFEFRIVRADGSHRWVFTHAKVDLDASGKPVRLSGSVQDITERHEAEARLAESEERYRRIVETTAQGVLTDDGQLITFANRRAAELLGTTTEALVGTPLRAIVAPEAMADLDLRRERRLAGLTDTYDLPLVTASGERVLVEMNATPLRDGAGAVEGALAMFSDVGLRRHAEELRARLAAIVESSRDAIVSCSLDGTIQTWNAAASKLYGYSAEEAIGMSSFVLVPSDQQGAYRKLMAKLQRGEVIALETTGIRKDGSRVDLVVTGSPVLDNAGNVVAVSSIARDLTAQRHAQKMEAIGALAGGIAHDFNNILSVVLSSATLIEESLDRQDPIVEDVRAVREAAERAATLTRQLLAFSRRQVLEPRVVNLDKIVSGMEKMLRRLIGERIELVMVPGDASNVLIDPGQFEQVLMNLVVNARDAMPDGGHLTIETELVTRRSRAYVRVSVSDTGIGMDDATRQRMFEPFFTTKERGKGTGLGLATVFGIVEQSGGLVEVDTARGRGTTISIFIPRTERVARTGAVTMKPPAKPARGETILVVEDEEPVRRLVIKLLRREGYEVLGAANAGEAVLIAEQRRDIDLLLTDVVMPIMNGRQLAERLRAAVPDLRVVFMSGYHDDEVLREMAGSPEVVYLQKPVPRDVLVEKLRELLDGPIIAACGSPHSSSS